MIVCGKCQAENLDDAKFCEVCGESLIKTCPRCKAEVSLKARFCSKCAMPLDGSYICGSCGSMVASDARFCATCGKDKNGCSVCVNCGEVSVDSSAAFCPSCGAAYKQAPAPAPIHANRAAVSLSKSGAATKERPILKLIVAWSMAGIMALLFAFSFLPIFKYTSSMENMSVSGNVSAIDIFGATFRMMNPPSQKELEKEFSDFMRENVNLSSTATPQETVDETIRIIKKFGILKLSISEESVKTSASLVLQLTLWAIATLALMGVLLGFFIGFLYSAIMVTIKPGYKPKKLAGIAFSLAFGLSLILGMLGAAKFGGGLITIMLISALTILGLATLKYILRQEKVNIRHLVAQGASLVLVVIMSACVMGNTVNVFAQSGDKLVTYKGKIGAFELIGGIDFSKRAEEGSMYNNEEEKLKAYSDAVLATLAQFTKRDAGTMISSQFNPIITFTFKETQEYIPMGVILSVVNLLGYLAAVAGLSGIAIFALKDIDGAKSKRRNIFNIMLLSGVMGMLVSGIIMVVSANIIMNELVIRVQYGIGAAIITALVFAIGHVVQNNILAPKKQKVEVEASAARPAVVTTDNDGNIIK